MSKGEISRTFLNGVVCIEFEAAEQKSVHSPITIETHIRLHFTVTGTITLRRESENLLEVEASSQTFFTCLPSFKTSVGEFAAISPDFCSAWYSVRQGQCWQMSRSRIHSTRKKTRITSLRKVSWCVLRKALGIPKYEPL